MIAFQYPMKTLFIQVCLDCYQREINMAKIILNLDVSIGYLGVAIPLYSIHKRVNSLEAENKNLSCHLPAGDLNALPQ